MSNVLKKREIKDAYDVAEELEQMAQYIKWHYDNNKPDGIYKRYLSERLEILSSLLMYI